LKDPLFLRGFWVLGVPIRNDFIVGLTKGIGLVDLGCEGEEEALACIALNCWTRGRSVRLARVLILFLFCPSPDWDSFGGWTAKIGISTTSSFSKSVALSKESFTTSLNISGCSALTSPNSRTG